MPTNLQLEFMSPVPSQDYQIVKFDGELDKAGFTEVKDRLDEFIENFKLKNLIFDFHHLRFINSEVIGYLVDVTNRLKQHGGKLILVNPSLQVKDVFSAIGISDIVPIFTSLNDFLKSK